MSNLSEQELIRREKLNKIRELGINPYPAELFQVTTNSSNIKSNFIEGEKVIVAGRLTVSYTHLTLPTKRIV